MDEDTGIDAIADAMLAGASRREIMRRAFWAAAAAAAMPVSVDAAPAAARLTADPFRLLGVASGDPGPTSVVIWCRLALDLADMARWGLSADAYRVAWEIRPAGEPGARPVRTGSAAALRDRGYAVHVEVAGLQPGRPYAYTFRLGGFEAGGITRTAPAAGVLADKLRFCACSCAEYENELYFAYDEMAKEQPDFILHLGDYIYENTYGRYFQSGVDWRPRKLKFDREKPVRTLEQYRRRYAEYKSDAMLQRAHAAAPWIVTWDDHEVANDYAGGQPASRKEKDFVALRIAAYCAYFENMPIRLSTLPVREGRRQLYRSLPFGRLLNVAMLDERQYRDPQACRFDDHLPNTKSVSLSECPQLESNRTILGSVQEAWINGVLSRSPARWNVLAQGVMFAHLETRRAGKSEDKERHMWTDTWSGYLPARQRMIDLMARHGAKNPVVLSGDIHSHFVNRIYKDWKKPGVDLVAPEFVMTSVSSFSRDLSRLVSDELNKDVVAWHGKSGQGYGSFVVTPDAFEATMVKLKNVDHATVTAGTDRSARFRVEPGSPDVKAVAG